MLWAQITLLVLQFSALLFAANQDGKPRTGTSNFFYSVIAIAINFAILFFAGAFSHVFHH